MISTSNFLNPIQYPHPFSLGYIDYWKQEKRRCIEGYWVSGRWMPGKLYFYGNFGTIRLNKGKAKTKVFDRPWIRDVEWMIFLYIEEARGFSGFEGDKFETCDKFVLSQNEFDSEDILDNPHCFNNGTPKRYVNAREYIRRIHPENFGRPLYNNEAKNFLMVGPRGYGKTYITSHLILHEWLFDGSQAYFPTTNFRGDEARPSTDVIVGAADAKYTNNLLAKTRAALESLPGSQKIGGKLYPNAFSKKYFGSWNAGKDIVAGYQTKDGGTWEAKGSLSTIKNRTFRDNAFAAQGSRSSLSVFEEIGMFPNLRESFAALDPVFKDGDYKYGTMVLIGTGGDMDGGGTLDTMYMFYNPDEFDILTFKDEWEGNEDIAYFVPAELGLNNFKDKLGETNWEKASAYLDAARKKRANESSMSLKNHIVYYPRKPSEVFLSDQGSVFPIPELQARLSQVMYDKIEQKTAKKATLYYDPQADNGVSYSIDTRNTLTPINEFPWKKDTREGCLTIYELPITDENNNVPEDLYLIGHDPVKTDDDGPSLSSVYVMKTKKYLTKYGHDEIVAQFVGRPFQGRNVVNELILQLSMFYGNAKIYFENMVGNTKEFFEKRKRLDLLATQPTTILTSKRTGKSGSANVVYGYPISNLKFKKEAMIYLRDWLLEERQNSSGETIRNLDLIADRALLQELIAFNFKGNFDRVMGLAGCILGMEEKYNKYAEQIEFKPRYDISFITKNPILKKLNNEHNSTFLPKATPIF